MTVANEERESEGFENGAAGPERQQAIDTLCEAFANDELGVEEFERRVEAAHRSASAEDLRRLLSDLPSGRALHPAPAKNVPLVAAPDHPLASTLSTAPPAWGFSVGIMGGMGRRGRWQAARRNVAIGVMGGCTLDFRDAVLPAGVTEVHALAFWGGIEIIVPPWLRVETSGIGIMGGFDYNHDTSSVPPADAPILKVSGVAIMAGVEVKVRLPGETGKDARRRIKDERRARRLTSGGLPPGEE